MATKQQIRSIPPVNREVWAFSLGGLVRHPLSLSFADLAALPAVTQTISVICTACQSIDTADYTGVPVSALLDMVEYGDSAANAVIHAYDGYSTLLPLADLRDHAVVAYAIDGQSLTHEQGYPARLVIPGKYGYKLPKWVTRLELTDDEHGGFWEERGFGVRGNLTAVCEIGAHTLLTDGSIRVAGFAYSAVTPIQSIEIRVDGGAWTPIPFAARDAARADWEINWQPPYRNSVFTLQAQVNGLRPPYTRMSRPYTIRL